MPPETLKLLKDAVDDVMAFAADSTFEQFIDDKQKRMAIERGFEIVGEALSQLRKVNPAIAESFTDGERLLDSATS